MTNQNKSIREAELVFSMTHILPYLELLQENKRLKKLAHDLQQEIERHVLAEIHPMEDK